MQNAHARQAKDKEAPIELQLQSEDICQVRTIFNNASRRDRDLAKLLIVCPGSRAAFEVIPLADKQSLYVYLSQALSLVLSELNRQLRAMESPLQFTCTEHSGRNQLSLLLAWRKRGELN